MDDAGEIRSDSRTVINQFNQREVRQIRAMRWGRVYHIAMEVVREGRIHAASHVYPETQEDLKTQWGWAKAWLSSDEPRLTAEQRGKDGSKTEKAVTANAE